MKHLLFRLEEDLIYERLREIRENPAQWLGRKSLQGLWQYITGFEYGLWGLRSGELEWHGDFCEYVYGKCVKHWETYNIVSAIYSCGYDNESGFDYYFELLDDYGKEHIILDEKKCKVRPVENEIRILYVPRDFIRKVMSWDFQEKQNICTEMPALKPQVDYRFDLRNDEFYNRVLRKARVYPEMFFGKKSLERLFWNVKGYYDGRRSRKNVPENEVSWMEEFHSSICRTYGNGNKMCEITEMFISHGYDDESGFDYYFELLDTYTQKFALVQTTPPVFERGAEDMPQGLLQEHCREKMDSYVSLYKNELFRLWEGTPETRSKEICGEINADGGMIYAAFDEKDRRVLKEWLEEECRGKAFYEKNQHMEEEPAYRVMKIPSIVRHVEHQ